MFIDQGDLLYGMDRSFIKEFMELTVPEDYRQGAFIFREGDRADFFYTLIEGKVRLTLGDAAQEVYLVTHAGEAFGWSSLVERNYYSATAQCLTPTRVARLASGELNQLLHRHPENGFIFYKKLAAILGHRLVQCYHLLYP
jgi:CRP-like cAMP-binding protein